MLDAPVLLRVALIGLLAGAVAAETLPGGVPEAPAQAAPHGERSIVRSAAHQPVAAQLQAYLSTILARPLFRADRRPPVVAAGAPVAAAHGEAGLPRLSGIMLSTAGAAAIFEGGSKPVVARVGDRLGPFTVATIAAGSVTLDGPQGMQVMRPSFDKALAAAAPPTPIAPPPQRLTDPASLNLPPPPPPSLRGLLEQRRAMDRQQPTQQ